MSSDLKVTNIKHESSASNNLVLASDGSTTINQISSSSVFPSDSVLQIVTDTGVIRQEINNTTSKIFQSSITLSKANSNLWLDFQTWIGGFSSYTDRDLGLAIGWKTGSASSTVGDYTRIHHSDTTNLSREQVGSLGVFWNTDTAGPDGTGAQYWTFAFPYRNKVDLGTQSAGTVIQIAFWASSSGSYIIGSPKSGTLTDAGAETWLHIWELAS